MPPTPRSPAKWSMSRPPARWCRTGRCCPTPRSTGSNGRSSPTRMPDDDEGKEQQMEWRQAAAARGRQVTDLAEHVATAIDGIDLSGELDAEMVAISRAACVERTLLLFRGQQALTPAAYLAFAHRFGGRPDLHSLRHYCLPDHHEIFVVGNVHEKQANV